MMPFVKLEENRDYTEMIHKFLLNKNFEDYFIAQMNEIIKLNIDEKGARV